MTALRPHHLALRTRDVAGLAAFYRDVFGLSALRETPGVSVWLDLDGAVLMIERAGPGEPGVPAGSMEFVAFAVTAAQREALDARWRAEGRAVEHRTEHTVYLRDPDGRRVGVSSYPITSKT